VLLEESSAAFAGDGRRRRIGEHRGIFDHDLGIVEVHHLVVALVVEVIDVSEKVLLVHRPSVEVSAVPAPRFLRPRLGARFPRNPRQKGAEIGLLGLRNDRSPSAQRRILTEPDAFRSLVDDAAGKTGRSKTRPNKWIITWRGLDTPARGRYRRCMAQSILIFDFGTNEEAVQQARHKVEVWKQAFRLGDKISLKFEREEPAEKAAAADERPAEASGKTKSGGKKPAGKSA